jgi:CheY-like chemotaxis protein
MKRVLVVEDNALNMRLIQDILEPLQHEVIEAKNGPEALEILRQDHLDLVLLDVLLPGMNGIEVLKHIKTNPSLAEIPVVVMTASGDSSVHRQCVEAGCNGFVLRPFTRKVLLDALKPYIGG